MMNAQNGKLDSAINKIIFRYCCKYSLMQMKLYLRYIQAYIKHKIFKPKSVDKVIKYQKRCDEIPKNITILKKSLSFILFQMKRQNKIWLNSKEFKYKYLDANHPYPPLLNPNNINFECISADLAWELNLPLPPKYNLIIISGSNMGHNALLDFFEKCGAKRGQDHLPKDLKQIYTSFYDFLVNPSNADNFKILPFVQYSYLDYSNDEFKRYCEFFMREVPILVQVRDPFIKLLLVNDFNFKPNKPRIFTLSDNLPEILDRFEYVFGLNLGVGLNELITPHNLRQSTAINGLQKSKIDFIDTDNELMPKNAYETMKNLAKKYKLKEPQDRAFFEGIMEQDIFGLVPLTLSLSHQDACKYLGGELKIWRVEDSKSIDILITIYQLMQDIDYIDISNEIWGSNWLYKGSDIRLYIKKDEYEFFDEIMKEAAIKYFEYFKIEFMKRVELEIQKRFTSTDILNYLKKDKTLAQKLKNILDKELGCVKQMRPDIVESWEYYKKFESMF